MIETPADYRSFFMFGFFREYIQTPVSSHSVLGFPEFFYIWIFPGVYSNSGQFALRARVPGVFLCWDFSWRIFTVPLKRKYLKSTGLPPFNSNAPFALSGSGPDFCV